MGQVACLNGLTRHPDSWAKASKKVNLSILISDQFLLFRKHAIRLYRRNLHLKSCRILWKAATSSSTKSFTTCVTRPKPSPTAWLSWSKRLLLLGTRRNRILKPKLRRWSQRNNLNIRALNAFKRRFNSWKPSYGRQKELTKSLQLPWDEGTIRNRISSGLSSGLRIRWGLWCPG